MYVGKVCELMIEQFIDQQTNKPNVEQLILAGSGELKNNLFRDSRLDKRLKAIVGDVIDVAYGGTAGLEEATGRASHLMGDVEFVKQQQIIESLFEHIAQNTSLAMFGVQEVFQCWEAGAVEKLIVHEDCPVRRIVLESTKEADQVRFVSSPKELESLLMQFPNHRVVQDELVVDFLIDHHEDFGSELCLISVKSSQGRQFMKGLGGVGAVLRYPMQAWVEDEDDDDDGDDWDDDDDDWDDDDDDDDDVQGEVQVEVVNESESSGEEMVDEVFLDLEDLEEDEEGEEEEEEGWLSE